MVVVLKHGVAKESRDQLISWLKNLGLNIHVSEGNYQTILGLVIGGVCAAPLAAWICRKIPVRPLLAIVGILIIALNLYSLLQCLAVF